MRKFCYCFIALFLFIDAHAQTAESDSLATLKNIFRHYTGMAGRHEMVMDLRYSYPDVPAFGASTYYFTDEGGLNFFLMKAPSPYAHSTMFNAQVFPENIAMSNIGNVYSEQLQTARLSVTFSHDSLTGMWLNSNGQEQLPFWLKEDNSGLSSFIFKQAADSSIAVSKTNDTLKAVATYLGIQPSPKMSEKDVTFIGKSLSRFMGSPGGNKKDTHDFAHICFQKFLDGFRSATAGHKKLPGGNFNGIFTLFPVYTEDGFLVLQQGGYHYDFSNETYTDQDRYLCLDLETRKTLELSDILVQNNAMLSKLLENAFRKKYKLAPDKKLGDMFKADTMPLTNNFILVGKGLIFSYSPGNIFRDEEEISNLHEMRIFLSYEELGSLLKPDFKNRVGIK